MPDSLEVELLPLGIVAVRFRAMACPCEVLFEGVGPQQALQLATIAAHEAWRIERKFSRYRQDSVLAAIHAANGALVEVDAETTSLLDFAKTCFELSEGLFDITSGVLRRVWTFDGSDRIPDAESIARTQRLIGFGRLTWASPWLGLPAGMEIDFGGIGKEYAVDRATGLLAEAVQQPFLVNFGGDLRANRPPAHGAWQVGVERPDADGAAAMVLNLENGALATSGDSHRFLLKDGKRYGHVLNPITGWPVENAPRSVSVAAASCTEAGMWATMGLLKGHNAKHFLSSQQVRHWIIE